MAPSINAAELEPFTPDTGLGASPVPKCVFGRCQSTAGRDTNCPSEPRVDTQLGRLHPSLPALILCNQYAGRHFSVFCWPASKRGVLYGC